MPPSKQKRNFTFRMEAELKTQMIQLAEAQNRTASNWCENAVREKIERELESCPKT